MIEDLTQGHVEATLPEREVRAYPALLSTEATAMSWARSGAPEGAVVVADYQASPRGRGGLTWEVRQGEGLGFSLVLRPDLPAEREGWLYCVTASGLADAAGPSAVIDWPDELRQGESRRAAAGVYVQLGPERVEWAVATVLVHDVPPPRATALARFVHAIEYRYRAAPTAVLDHYRGACDTLDRRIRARMIPMGPTGAVVEGVARDVLLDGALLVETDGGNRVAVRPSHLGLLERLGDDR